MHEKKIVGDTVHLFVGRIEPTRKKSKISIDANLATIGTYRDRPTDGRSEGRERLREMACLAISLSTYRVIIKYCVFFRRF